MLITHVLGWTGAHSAVAEWVCCKPGGCLIGDTTSKWRNLKLHSSNGGYSHDFCIDERGAIELGSAHAGQDWPSQGFRDLYYCSQEALGLVCGASLVNDSPCQREKADHGGDHGKLEGPKSSVPSPKVLCYTFGMFVFRLG